MILFWELYPFEQKSSANVVNSLRSAQDKSAYPLFLLIFGI